MQANEPNIAALDWTQCSAVESVPGKLSGAWVFRGTRLPVATVIENLEDLSVAEVVEQFDVSRDQIAAALGFVAQGLRVAGSEGGRDFEIVRAGVVRTWRFRCGGDAAKGLKCSGERQLAQNASESS